MQAPPGGLCPPCACGSHTGMHVTRLPGRTGLLGTEGEKQSCPREPRTKVLGSGMPQMAPPCPPAPPRKEGAEVCVCMFDRQEHVDVCVVGFMWVHVWRGGSMWCDSCVHTDSYESMSACMWGGSMSCDSCMHLPKWDNVCMCMHVSLCGTKLCVHMSTWQCCVCVCLYMGVPICTRNCLNMRMLHPESRWTSGKQTSLPNPQSECPGAPTWPEEYPGI